MDDKALRDLLGQLHGELEHGPPIEDETRDLLRELDRDIHALLDRRDEESAGEGIEASSGSLGDRLHEATVHLEESHPKLTATVGQLVEALATIFK